MIQFETGIGAFVNQLLKGTRELAHRRWRFEEIRRGGSRSDQIESYVSGRCSDARVNRGGARVLGRVDRLLAAAVCQRPSGRFFEGPA